MDDKRDFLFRFIPVEKRKLLKLDEEALYSVTDQYTADKISKEIKKQFPDIQTITDMTACIGGNTYSFSKYFESVHAIELDKLKYDYLSYNLTILDVNTVKLHHGDSLSIVPTLQQDILFIDPPWGGPNYKDKKHIDLYLSDIELSEVCRMLIPYSKYIALKVPINFDLDKFTERTNTFMVQVYKNTDLRKMQLLLYTTMNTG
jgi:16S rRNA G966 N2-methylase RsmD